MEAKLTGSENPAGRAFGKVLERMPVASEVMSSMRSTAAWAKLLLLAPAQFVVQGSQALINYGANPIHAVGGTKDALMALTGMGVRRFGNPTPFSNEMERLIGVAERSGYFADVSTVDATQLARFKGGSGINRIPYLTKQ